MVTEIDDDATARIRVGDIILEADSKTVSSPDDLINAVKEANRQERKAVLLLIRSGNETRFEAVPLKRG